ncbi:MAG: flagellar type III secretion system pore protein FliP, partial [Treponema sp.]|nr:flagellar type III secretion system pore protein FliP [Treponema sp.]
MNSAVRRVIHKLSFLFIVGFLSVLPAVSQSSTAAPGNSAFPEGSTQGTTEMSEGITGIDFPNISFSASAPQDGHQVAFSIELLLLLSILTLAPSIMLLCTCFLRFSIVLDFIKRALSLQQVPPTAVLNGIALFMAIFCMRPTFQRIYTDAFKPLSNNEMTLTEAFANAEKPIKLWMFSQMDENDGGRPAYESYVGKFMKMAGMGQPKNLDEVPLTVIIPAYILHELTVAFKIGILLYIPFIVIDMVVASILMSMGMMMLPPVQISMPFKLMLFVLVDGWGLLTTQL